MPELPDIEVYITCLDRRVRGAALEAVRLANPFFLRTVEPPLSATTGRRVETLSRMGKRIVLGLQGGIHLVLHLMIAGRLHWQAPRAAVPKKRGLAAFDFPEGCLIVTEAGSHRRASLHVVAGADALAALDPGGTEVFDADVAAFHAVLVRENHTLKRALTDPRLFSGIGNAYSDEILHRARLSPLAWTQRLADDEVARLFAATQRTLADWTERLRVDAGDGFPERVTAFREGMAAHGRYGKPCPDCGAPIQRIVYASSETNYCPRCQTEGKVLADRALSRLLKKDWPQTLDALEKSRAGREPPILSVGDGKAR